MKLSLLSLLPLAAGCVAMVGASDAPTPGSKEIFSKVNNATESALGEQFFDDEGKPIVFTTNADEEQDLTRRRNKKHGKHHKSLAKSNSFKAVTSTLPTGQKKYGQKIHVTWYGAHDLQAPSCGDGSWNPNDGSFIGAVGDWADKPECGEYVSLCKNGGDTKCITIRIVDSCAGCKSDHIDLTKGAFKELAGSGGLDEGVVDNLSLYRANTPNPFNTDLFGPFKLKN